jgi:hypothetical protein
MCPDTTVCAWRARRASYPEILPENQMTYERSNGTCWTKCWTLLLDVFSIVIGEGIVLHSTEQITRYGPIATGEISTALRRSRQPLKDGPKYRGASQALTIDIRLGHRSAPRLSKLTIPPSSINSRGTRLERICSAIKNTNRKKESFEVRVLHRREEALEIEMQAPQSWPSLTASSPESKAGRMRLVVRLLLSTANRSSESPWVSVRSADETPTRNDCCWKIPIETRFVRSAIPAD